jgi:Kef-type K+ transport system membrane component KefB
LYDATFLRELGFIILAAAIFSVAARPARIPSLVAYILAGLALGPVTGFMTVSETVHLASEVGIALLLFLVGLELSLDKIRDVGKVAVAAGLGQVVFTAAGGFVLSMALSFSPMESLFIATALTFSSTVVVVKLLDQKGDLDALYGRIAVGIFLVQDLVVIVVLTVLAGLGRQEAQGVVGVGVNLALAFGGMALLLALAAAASRWVLPRLFAWVAHSPEILFTWSLTWCFLFVLGAEKMQLSLEIGAFLAGISLAQLPYNHEMRRRVHPLMNFFIAVFFVSLGIQMEFSAAREHWLPGLILSLFVLVGNPFIFMWIIARAGFGERTSFRTSVTVAQISEFSFIFAAMGMGAGLIKESILSLIGIVGLVTIAVSAYMILYADPLYEYGRRWGLLKMFRARKGDDAQEPERASLSGHVIIVGMNSLGRRLARELTERKEIVLAVDSDPRKLADLPCLTLLGNAEHGSVLNEAGLGQARLLVSALHIEETNNLLTHRARSLGIPVSVHAFETAHVPELQALGATHLLFPRDLGAERFLDAAQRHGAFQA